MFFAMRRVMAALARPVAAMRARAAARQRAQLEARARAVLALARPAQGRLVVLPPQLPLPQVLQEAQALRAGVVPAALVPVLPILTRGSPRSTASSARTARRSTSKRRRAR